LRWLRLVAVLLALGGLIGGWIALRDNGLLGGLDHAGSLLVRGVNDAINLDCQPRQLGADHLVNHGDDRVVIDRIALDMPRVERRDLDVSSPVTFDISRKEFYLGPRGTMRLPDVRSAKGLAIEPGGTRGVSYGVSVRPSGIPRYEGSSIEHVIDGLIVDYHAGSRHFRAKGGIQTKSLCTAPKGAPEGP
jgi:hypothetical protein